MEPTRPEPSLEESIAQVMHLLPPPIRNYLAQGKYTAVAKGLMTKYGLHIDQANVLEREIMLLLMGIKNPDEFVQTLATEARLGQQAIGSIVQDVNAQIFIPLRQEMMRAAPQAPQPTEPHRVAPLPPRPPQVNAPVPRYIPPKPPVPPRPPVPTPHALNIPTPKLPPQSPQQMPPARHLENKIPPPPPPPPASPVPPKPVAAVPSAPPAPKAAPLPPKTVLPRPAGAFGGGGPRTALADVLAQVTKPKPIAPEVPAKPAEPVKLLEDHEEPHIEFKKTAPPPPNLPGAMLPIEPKPVLPAPKPTPPIPPTPPAPPKQYQADPYREPIDEA